MILQSGHTGCWSTYIAKNCTSLLTTIVSCKVHEDKGLMFSCKCISLNVDLPRGCKSCCSSPSTKALSNIIMTLFLNGPFSIFSQQIPVKQLLFKILPMTGFNGDCKHPFCQLSHKPSSQLCAKHLRSCVSTYMVLT